MNPLNCKEVTARMALGDLSQLSRLERWTVRFHMAICWVCRKYEKQIRVIAKAFQHNLETSVHAQDISNLKKRLIDGLGK